MSQINTQPGPRIKCGVSHNMGNDDLYRMRRIQKSSLIKCDLSEIEHPNIKPAEHLYEYRQAFKLVHDEYADSGYITPSPDHPFHYSIYSFLPETRVFIFQSHRKVLATLTQVFDSSGFGLPMDCLYERELDGLRQKNRLVTEISALATARPFRMRNLTVHLWRATLKHSRANSIDDICIMVNPKHVRFYTKILLFEQFGPLLFYDKVQAQAVPLRVDVNRIEERLREKYGRLDQAENLHAFFCGADSVQDGLIPRHRAGDTRTRVTSN